MAGQSDKEDFQPRPYEGVLHHFSPSLVAFEYRSQSTRKNIVIFIGGLGDGLLTVPYVPTLAASLPPSWSLAQVILSSSYLGWGTSSLQKDVRELSECVGYFRKLVPNGGKIVLIGHSTGCQDCLEYLVGTGYESRERIDGAVIQAPVSDREGINMIMEQSIVVQGTELARKMVGEDRANDVLPSSLTNGFFFGSTVTAARWLSLVSPDHDGEDDLFSSDLPVQKLEQTFGKVPTGSPLCILPGSNDQYVPQSVDKDALLKKWIDVMTASGAPVDLENSGLVQGANHNVSNGAESVRDLLRRILGFLAAVEAGKWY